MRYSVLLMLCMVMCGCNRYAKPATPAEQEAQEQMMRNVLRESSPRNMNEHPKVTDEFKKTFNTGRSRDNKQSSQDAPLTKQSEDDEESW